MKATKINVLGFEYSNYMIPESVEENDQLAGRVGATLDMAIKQELAHGSYTTIRATLCDILEGKEIVHPVKNPDGTERKFKSETVYGTRRMLFKNEPVTAEETEKDGKKIITYFNPKGKKLSEDQAAEVKRETEKNFVDRIVAENGGNRAVVEPLFVTAVEFSPYDPSATERKEATNRIPKTWIKVAEEIVANGAAANAAIQIGQLLNKTLDISNPDTVVTVLATAIWENEQREAAQRKNKYTAIA